MLWRQFYHNELWLLLLLASCWAHAAAPRTIPGPCGDCLREPLETEYFGGTLGGEPPRLGTVSREEFEVAARRGSVLILENASAGMALEGWTCERLAQEFPAARMRREYDWVTNPEDRNLQELGQQAWLDAVVAGEDAEERRLQDPQAPPFAPFYWGVREHGRGDLGPRKAVRRVRKLIQESVPRFMDPRVGESLSDNAEFWLGARGTGARAHMDSHCRSTLSVVLSGERRWRIGPVPRMPPGAGRSRNEDVIFDDGVAYRMGWKPMFEFTLKEGEAVVFPPGWIHETLNTAEGCTVALTTQFDSPVPVRYYRSFYSRLRRVGDLNPCWGEMISWAAGPGGDLPRALRAAPEEARAAAREKFAARAARGGLSAPEVEFFDVDGDGSVAEAEFAETFAAWAATERAIRKERAVATPQPDMSLADPHLTEGGDRREGEGEGEL